MKRIIKYGIVLFLFNFNNLFSQNYIQYQKTINRIDKDILRKKYETAIVRADSIYSNHSFIFAKHCIKFLQISCTINDTSNAKKWLIKSFSQGVPLWIVRNNGIAKKVFSYSNCLKPIKNYDKYYSIYLSKINLKLVKTIDSLMVIDQKYTHKVNNGFVLFRHTIYGVQWLKNNKRQFEIIKQLIEKYDFPGEQLIGLPNWFNDSVKSSNSMDPI